MMTMMITTTITKTTTMNMTIMVTINVNGDHIEDADDDVVDAQLLMLIIISTNNF